MALINPKTGIIFTLFDLKKKKIITTENATNKRKLWGKSVDININYC